MKSNIRFSALAILSACGLSLASQAEWETRGYVKSQLLGSAPETDLADPMVRMNALGRWGLFGFVNDQWTHVIAYEMNAVLANLSLPAVERTYRVADFNSLFGHHGDLELHHNLDRLWTQYETPTMSLKIGRQPIGLGTSRVLSPMDVLTPFSVSAIDKDERLGVDAVRFTQSFGDSNEIELSFIGGPSMDKSALYARWLQSGADWDRGFLIMRYHRNTVIGLSFEGSLFDQSAWFEAAYKNLSNDQSGFATALGLSYQITPESSLFGEWYGHTMEPDPNSLAQEEVLVAQQKRLSQGILRPPGSSYLHVGGSWQAHPLLALVPTVSANLNDESLLLITQMQWNLLENMYLDFIYVTGLGAEASEFENQPTTLITFFRYYY